MAFIRHRIRSIQESVFQDLRDTLIACRWVVGTTSHEVTNPDNSTWQNVTRVNSDLFKIAEGHPIILLDYFPDSGEVTEPNTFAVDVAQPGEKEFIELGSNLVSQPYLFSFAMYASSDAVAIAVMNDLEDRYLGRIIRPEYIELFDYGSSDPTVVQGRVDIDAFRYSRDMQTAAPHELHLYFCELEVTDYP